MNILTPSDIQKLCLKKANRFSPAIICGKSYCPFVSCMKNKRGNIFEYLLHSVSNEFVEKYFFDNSNVLYLVQSQWLEGYKILSEYYKKSFGIPLSPMKNIKFISKTGPLFHAVAIIDSKNIGGIGSHLLHEVMNLEPKQKEEALYTIFSNRIHIYMKELASYILKNNILSLEVSPRIALKLFSEIKFEHGHLYDRLFIKYEEAVSERFLAKAIGVLNYDVYILFLRIFSKNKDLSYHIFSLEKNEDSVLSAAICCKEVTYLKAISEIVVFDEIPVQLSDLFIFFGKNGAYTHLQFFEDIFKRIDPGLVQRAKMTAKKNLLQEQNSIRCERLKVIIENFW